MSLSKEEIRDSIASMMNTPVARRREAQYGTRRMIETVIKHVEVQITQLYGGCSVLKPVVEYAILCKIKKEVNENPKRFKKIMNLRYKRNIAKHN